MSSLHFCPADGWFGDPMPLWHDGVYHVYYTKMYHNKKVGWGHISSTDLVEYTEHPDPFPCGEEGTPTSTGCVYWHDGKFHAYYAGKDFTMLHSESDYLYLSGRDLLPPTLGHLPSGSALAGSLCVLR